MNKSKNMKADDIEKISAVFAHDLSTPLSIATMLIDLLAQHKPLWQESLQKPGADALSPKTKTALENAPHVIQKSLYDMQSHLSKYKEYLSTLHDSESNGDDHTTTPIAVQYDENLSILLVDDEDIHHDIADAVLGPRHHISHVHNGMQAVEHCRKESFHVILMDMQMPTMSGAQTTAKIRSFAPKNTLIIGLSNMSMADKKQELLASGFNGFLEKPLKSETFNSLVESLTIAN